MSRLALCLVAGLALVLGGCGLIDRQPMILNGLSIGADAGCGACDQPQTSAGDCGACESIAKLAAHHLQMDDPGHPAVAATEFFSEGGHCCGPSGELVLLKRSGGLIIAVATFVGGTRHAVAVYCGVGGCH